MGADVRIAKRTAGAALGVLALVTGIAPSPAMASTNPGPVYSSYNFNTTLNGQTQFTVYGNGKATVTLIYGSGVTETVTVQIEQQTCGIFGCNWNGRYVGGSCKITLSPPRNGGNCTFSIGNTNTLNRVHLSKTFDGQTITGEADIS